MTTHATVIRGYHVTLDLDMNGDLAHGREPSTGCWIERRGFSASLECADAEGFVEDIDGRQLAVPSEILDAIRAWAEERGY